MGLSGHSPFVLVFAMRFYCVLQPGGGGELLCSPVSILGWHLQALGEDVTPGLGPRSLLPEQERLGR